MWEHAPPSYPASQTTSLLRRSSFQTTFCSVQFPAYHHASHPKWQPCPSLPKRYLYVAETKSSHSVRRQALRRSSLRTSAGYRDTNWKLWRRRLLKLVTRTSTQEDELQTGCNTLVRKVDKKKLEVEENASMVDDYANQQFFYSQSTEQYTGNPRLPLWKTRKLSAAMISLVLAGLILCPQAWAGTEVSSASWLGDLGDIKSGFVSAFLLIFFSEIGDKTFFIAALLASRKSNAAVFTGTFGALVAMTFISVFLGRTFHYIDGILPFSLGENELPLDDLAAVVLLVYFGVSTLLEASSMEGSKAEQEEQEAELAIAGVGGDGLGLRAAANTALATFALVFVAEWGDKSFFSTVALAAASSPLGVVSGAIAGHGVATVLAVLGGSFLSTYISEKVIAYTGGILFLVFAAATLVEIFK